MATSAVPFPAASSTILRLLPIYLREIRYEMVRSLRNRTFSLSVIGFPAMFYLLFGVANRGQTFLGGKTVAKYILSGYAGFGVVGAALFGIGVGLAFDRTSGWLALKRASPMPPLAYLIARCAMALMLTVVIVSVLCVLGVTAAKVELTWGDYGHMLAVAALGSIPFAAMGLLLAMVLPSNSAPGIVNLLYLPMSYASGLWVPVPMLPHLVQRVAPWLPTYHLAQLMLHTVGYAPRGDSIGTHVLALLGFTCVFLGLASIAFSRKEDA